ncbi:peptide/nickel transport system substrate-binding protein [Mycetocola sp. BIGb0189]|uniref:ABC transporter substrate-binding protein n=1 Tax=Mycetocola sp. BIGb0189 TaxID=2940604 RepID=UPI002168AA29|nr:ABC transporter substrate-binding protein [Mycetocola sp. BIGb0189]MCS4275474.1 peptide/nickel transport system substrate-binding protein [Mycetocola sp. BIGb0189]
MKFSRKSAATAGLVVAAALALSGCAGGSNGAAGGGDAGKSLVVDASFDLKTADPNRQYETTGSIVAKALYQTLLTFEGNDVTKPVDGLASYTMNPENTVMTLTLKPGAKFSDGSPVTVDDAVFSLTRVQGVKGNPSFLLDGITVAKTGDDTLTLTSAEPNPALPFILPNPALSVVNKKVVEANGGSDTESDKAEAFLNKTSAGSGPYKLESFDAAKQVVLTANPEYNGPKPAYSRVVLRNVAGPTQKLNVEKGESQVALDLNPDQVAELAGSKVKITSDPSRYMIFLLLNQNKDVSQITSNPDFLKAVKLGIDYDKIVKMAGDGSVRPGGPIPSLFVGAIDAKQGNQRDVEAAKEALKASGYNGEKVTLNFPNDITVQGLSLQNVAEAVQAQLKDVGIDINLAPAPVATELDAYRNGTETVGLWYWGPDFPDASNYLVFSPGELVGLRAGWPAGADPKVTELANAAKAATGDARAAAYEAWQKELNASGPFVPLLQPAQSIVTAPSITSVTTNPVWTVDLALIK